MPAETFLVVDARATWVLDTFPGHRDPTPYVLKNNLGWMATQQKDQGFRHSGMHNVAFCDGHVKSIAKDMMLQNTEADGSATPPPWNIDWEAE
jgi:prepilin-type processing-associated H-X9-DG protein